MADDSEDEQVTTIGEPSTDILEGKLKEGAYAPPESLIYEPDFICYQIIESDDPDEKDNKVPSLPEKSYPTPCDATDPANGVTFYEAMEAVHDSKEKYGEDGLDGIGLQITEENDVIGIDIDDAVDAKAGDIEEWASDLITRVDSYTEISPSGTGLHILCTGEIADDVKNRNDELGLEIYDDDRYFTITGRTIRSTRDTVEERGEIVSNFARGWIGEAEDDESVTDMESVDYEPDQDVELDESDEELIEKAKNRDPDFAKLFNGSLSGYSGDHSRADMALASKLAYWCKSDRRQMDRIFRKSGLHRAKWERDDYRRMTLDEAIKKNGH
jgi:primase-polymerase (primpol)-like protein